MPDRPLSPLAAFVCPSLALMVALGTPTARTQAQAPAPAPGPPGARDGGNGTPLTQVAPAVPAPISLPTLAPKELARLARFDGWFGLYVNGHKVGWLHEVLKDAPHIEWTLSLEASLGGMGRQSHVSMQERRVYASRGEGLLESVSFQQKAQTGAVRVEGKRRGPRFEVTVDAGGARRRQTLDVPEALADALAAFRLGGLSRDANALRVGDHLAAQHFDASSQAVTGAQVRIEDIASELKGGVATPIVHLVTRYPTLGLTEKSVLDARGHLLRMQIGSFFEARREPAEVAQTKVVPSDLLMGSVVPLPASGPSAHPERAERIELTLTGVGELALPESPGQRVQRRGESVDVILTREPPLPATLPFVSARLDPRARRLPAEVREALLPTAWLQSDAPEVVAMAARATVHSRSAADAVQALVQAVRHHLVPEYVPSLSNALEALRSRRGDCTEHSALFVALARSLGLPARVAVGAAYWPPGRGLGWHAWAEVWLDGRWRSVDPTWGQATADVTHLKISGGDPAEQVRLVMALGSLRVPSWREVGAAGALP